MWRVTSARATGQQTMEAWPAGDNRVDSVDWRLFQTNTVATYLSSYSLVVVQWVLLVRASSLLSVHHVTTVESSLSQPARVELVTASGKVEGISNYSPSLILLSYCSPAEQLGSAFPFYSHVRDS